MIPERLNWQDKGEVISQSTAIELGWRLAILKPYAIVPDDMWGYLLDQVHKQARISLSAAELDLLMGYKK